jgi:S-adenosylmethionine hydrolase
MAIITLSSDVGQQDFLVGAIKGQLLSQDDKHNIVDITHYLSNTNYPQAAYICANAFKYFPANTFHIVILNFYALPITHLLVAKHNNQYIICPDNGILTMIVEERPKEVAKLSIPPQTNDLLAITGVIAKAISYILKTENFFTLTDPNVAIVEKLPLRPHIGFETIECQILFIDNFENAVLNITKEQFEEQRKGRPFVILISRNEEVTTISSHYSSVQEGDCLAWFNSAGYLEIAINKGNVASLFGLQGYHENMNKLGKVTQNKHFYHTIKIFFGV